MPTEPPFDSVPPLPEPPVDEAADGGRGPNLMETVSTFDPDTSGQVPDVEASMTRVYAGLHGRLVSDAAAVLDQVEKQRWIFAFLSEENAAAALNILEMLQLDVANTLGGRLDLLELPRVAGRSTAARSRAEQIVQRINDDDVPSDPMRTFLGLVEELKRHKALLATSDALKHLRDGASLEEIQDVIDAIPTLSETTHDESDPVWHFAKGHEVREALEPGPAYRLSSGYATLDKAMSVDEDEPLGAFAPGEFHVIVAPTGNGKSAFGRRLLVSLGEDLIYGWGKRHATIAMWITEESAAIVRRAAELNKGQPFHHLADNIAISNPKSSRRQMAGMFYDLIAHAATQAEKTGLPITEFAPAAFLVDYIGEVYEPGENPDTDGLTRTASLLRGGIAQCDLDAVEFYTGLSYEEHTGSPKPDGLGPHKVAVIAFGQFRKIGDIYRPHSRNTNIEDFTRVINGEPAWEPRAGDQAIPHKQEIRGSGVLANHATSILLLHRSRVDDNSIQVRADGRTHVDDDRARILFLKTRNASKMPFVPLRFDSQIEGPRGQFYDYLAEKAIEDGRLSPSHTFKRTGDPILPERPKAAPLAHVSY